MRAISGVAATAACVLCLSLNAPTARADLTQWKNTANTTTNTQKAKAPSRKATVHTVPPPSVAPPAMRQTATTIPPAMLRPQATTTTTLPPSAASTPDVDMAAVDKSLLPEGVTAPVERQWKAWDDGAAARGQDPRFRIALGIRTGTLTITEDEAITDNFQTLATLQEAIRPDAPLSADQRRQLHKLVTQTTEMIYRSKADADTRPKPNSALLKLVDGDMTAADAKELIAEIRRVNALKRGLAGNQPLSASLLNQAGAEFDTLGAILSE